MNLVDIAFALACFAVFAFIVYKVMEWILKNKHEDYLKNVTDRLIKDCILNCPEGIGELKSAYLHKSFGQIVGWMPGSLLGKKDSIVKTKKEEDGRKLEYKKEDFEVHKLFFYAVIPDYIKSRFGILRALLNMGKSARLVVIPMNLVSQKSLNSDVMVNVYSLVTREGDMLVPSNTNISDSDFSGFVKTEYLMEAQADILRKVGKLVDKHSDMVGSEELMQGMFRAQNIPKGGKE